MITGARHGKLSGLRRLTALAMARDLRAFLVPGPDIARAHGLDIEAAGMQIVASPRHASVLLVVGAIPPPLREAAAVIYAQMMRPRALFVLGSDELDQLPEADVRENLSQQYLIKGVRRLRTAFAEGAFRSDVADFDAPMLHARIEYTCPMHPEVVRDEPGSCPKCGMNLVAREAQAPAGHTHTDQQEMIVDADMHATSDQDHAGHHGMDHDTSAKYTCPMHPEVEQNEPGSCPKCGMNLELRESQGTKSHEDAGINPDGDHSGMDHRLMDHGDTAFMSMIDVTKDLPRSSDGLPMDWIDVPFGPFFPGLPGGLLLTLTLDGDTVAGSSVQTLGGNEELLQHSAMDSGSFIERLARVESLAPVSYRLLACRATENAAGVEVPAVTACARVGALERERIASHLGWLALFGQQTGFDWLQRCAASLQLKVQNAGIKQVLALKPDMEFLIKRLQRTPLLKSRTAGIGRLAPNAALHGPVARAAGISNDARSTDPSYSALRFTPVSREGCDAQARLQVRVEEITHSLALIAAAGVIEPPTPINIGEASGAGEAVVETPRGVARLRLTLEKGRVIAAQLETPSTHHLALIDPLIQQLALGDALVAIGSLDLAPWEVRQ